VLDQPIVFWHRTGRFGAMNPGRCAFDELPPQLGVLLQQHLEDVLPPGVDLEILDRAELDSEVRASTRRMR
jgi:hypothetical protein